MPQRFPKRQLLDPKNPFDRLRADPQNEALGGWFLEPKRQQIYALANGLRTVFECLLNAFWTPFERVRLLGGTGTGLNTPERYEMLPLLRLSRGTPTPKMVRTGWNTSERVYKHKIEWNPQNCL